MTKKKSKIGAIIFIFILVVALLGVAVYFNKGFFGFSIIGQQVATNAAMYPLPLTVSGVATDGQCRAGTMQVRTGTTNYYLSGYTDIGTVDIDFSFTGPTLCTSSSNQPGMNAVITCHNTNNGAENQLGVIDIHFPNYAPYNNNYNVQSNYRSFNLPQGCNRITVAYQIQGGDKGRQTVAPTYNAYINAFIAKRLANQYSISNNTQLGTNHAFETIFPNCPGDYCSFTTSYCNEFNVGTASYPLATYNCLNNGECIGYYTGSGNAWCSQYVNGSNAAYISFTSYSDIVCPAGSCTVNSRRCNAALSAVETCVDQNSDTCGDAWQVLSGGQCSNGQQCSLNGGLASCSCSQTTCIDNQNRQHQFGDTWCETNTNLVYTCGQNSNGCPVVESTGCSNGWQCDENSPGACYSPVDECGNHEPGDSWCSTNQGQQVLNTCLQNPPVFGPRTIQSSNCQDQEVCQQQGNTAYCGCTPQSNECDFEGQIVCDEFQNSYSMCHDELEGSCTHYILQPYQICDSTYECVDNQGCVAVNECSPGTPDTCDGTRIKRCSNNGERYVWTYPNDCLNQGKVCSNGQCIVPSSTVITTSDNHGVGQDVYVNVTLTRNGAPQPNKLIQVVLWQGASGSVEVGRQVMSTDTYGRALNVNLGSSDGTGLHTIEVLQQVEDSDQYVSVGTRTVNVLSALVVSLQVPGNIFVSTPTRVSATAQDIAGSPISNPVFVWSIRKNGNSIPYTTIDADTIEFTISTTGDIEIGVTGSKSGYLPDSDSFPTSVRNTVYDMSIFVDDTNINTDNRIDIGVHEIKMCLKKNSIPSEIGQFAMQIKTPASAFEDLNGWSESGNCYVKNYDFRVAGVGYTLKGHVVVSGETEQPAEIDETINTIENYAGTGSETSFWYYAISIVAALIAIIVVIMLVTKKKRR